MTGTVVTAFIHSSSAVMVLTVGLASSGLIPFRQTIGIMLGSNIGTTFTLEMFTLDMNYLIVPSMIIGCILYFFRSSQIRSSGMIFIGFGLIFHFDPGHPMACNPFDDSRVLAFLHDSG